MLQSDPTDSFMVNITVAQLPGHSRAQGFTAGARAPVAPPPWRRHCGHCGLSPGLFKVSEFTNTHFTPGQLTPNMVMEQQITTLKSSIEV